jgi:hypothetical protein
MVMNEGIMYQKAICIVNNNHNWRECSRRFQPTNNRTHTRINNNVYMNVILVFDSTEDH